MARTLSKNECNDLYQNYIDKRNENRNLDSRQLDRQKTMPKRGVYIQKSHNNKGISISEKPIKVLDMDNTL